MDATPSLNELVASIADPQVHDAAQRELRKVFGHASAVQEVARAVEGDELREMKGAASRRQLVRAMNRYAMGAAKERRRATTVFPAPADGGALQPVELRFDPQENTASGDRETGGSGTNHFRRLNL